MSAERVKHDPDAVPKNVHAEQQLCDDGIRQPMSAADCGCGAPGDTCCCVDPLDALECRLHEQEARDGARIRDLQHRLGEALNASEEFERQRDKLVEENTDLKARLKRIAEALDII